MNRCIRGPYVQWCERRTPSLFSGGAAYSIRRSCLFCQFYKHEEVGDSDFGAVYADVATCQKYLDTDPETEEDIPNFDREIERECCVLDFWQVVEVDEDLAVKLAEEAHTTGKMEETYEMFKTRYNCA